MGTKCLILANKFWHDLFDVTIVVFIQLTHKWRFGATHLAGRNWGRTTKVLHLRYYTYPDTHTPTDPIDNKRTHMARLSHLRTRTYVRTHTSTHTRTHTYLQTWVHILPNAHAHPEALARTHRRKHMSISISIFGTIMYTHTHTHTHIVVILIVLGSILRQVLADIGPCIDNISTGLWQHCPRRSVKYTEWTSADSIRRQQVLNASI